MTRKEIRQWCIDIYVMWDEPEEAKSLLSALINMLTTNQEKRRILKLNFNQKPKENGKNKARRSQ